MLTHWDATTLKKFLPYVREYESLHPGIRIQVQTVPFANLLNKIIVDQLSGHPPDIYRIY